MIKRTILLCSLTALFVSTLNSQNQTNSKLDIEAIITYHDSIFWKGFNTCDFNIIKRYIADDLEFYHDKAGITNGINAFMTNLKNGLCSNTEHYKLRREVIPGSIRIYPMSNYGAIISGDHAFFITEKDKPEYKDGLAKFTHLWILKDNAWKMSRVLSYDHKSP
ncbi:nuclear transport factor 2 family protein [Seonamhaeicola sp.]|uniref:nuclear transport factor 2 family protein n=1 Tax=Seonamhaeicola sp. TaxID=1912245 RepID=UPI00260A049D|nr:nuclear transport factor 2 family protein [Seonamhaeicola sp.]